jgi:hypothetical protein
MTLWLAITSVQIQHLLFSFLSASVFHFTVATLPSFCFIQIILSFLLREIKEHICITWVNCILNITNAHSLLLHVSYRQNKFLFSKECGGNLVRHVKL